MKDRCYFCRETECLQEHHVVPRRMGGTDDEENLLTLCPTCHRKVENKYSERFYEQIFSFFGFKEKYENWRERDNPGRPQKHSKQEVEQIVSDYRSGMSWDKIAEKHDTSHPTIMKRLKDEGVSLERDTPTPDPDHSPQEVDKMVEKYKSGNSYSELAEIFDTSKMTVHNRLSERGVAGDYSGEGGATDSSAKSSLQTFAS